MGNYHLVTLSSATCTAWKCLHAPECLPKGVIHCTIAGMLVATCVIKLRLDGVYSLKEKRRIVKSVLARLQQQFKLAVAEVDEQDVWQTAVIGLAVVGNDSAHLHSVLEKSVQWLMEMRPDVPVETYEIEFR